MASIFSKLFQMTFPCRDNKKIREKDKEEKRRGKEKEKGRGKRKRKRESEKKEDLRGAHFSGCLSIILCLGSLKRKKKIKKV